VINNIKDNVQRVIDQFDARQQGAVNSILDKWSSSDGEEFVFPIVDGPPGTGKTTVGTAALANYLLENPRGQVVYMCYTNFATAKAQESLYGLGLGLNQVVRLHANPKNVNWNKGLVGCTSDLSNLSYEDKRRLKECNILLCTLHGSGRASEARTARSHIVIDEFSQVSPPMFFHIIRRFRYKQPDGYALLGDPRQLPIISTQLMLRPNIGLFIMRRKPYQPHELVVQHRMHEDICDAVNSLRAALRTYPIKTGEDVKRRNLIEMGYKWAKKKITNKNMLEILDPEHPFVIVDTDQLKGAEKRAFGGSLKNVTEADLAVRIAKEFYDSYKKDSGQHLKPILLSPYSAQVSEISRKLPPELKGHCMTIYRSQGREYPCVIISFVRNNPQALIGFLKEPQLRAQTYVACSRAQGKLVVLYSRSTFIGHGHLDFEHLDSTRSAYNVKVRS